MEPAGVPAKWARRGFSEHGVVADATAAFERAGAVAQRANDDDDGGEMGNGDDDDADLGGRAEDELLHVSAAVHPSEVS